MSVFICESQLLLCRKSQHTQNQELLTQPPDELVDDSVVMDTAEPQDWSAFVDPSEPRYCICNEVSYGDMVACDNTDVSSKIWVAFSTHNLQGHNEHVFTLLIFDLLVSYRMVSLWVCWNYIIA